jgi:hypothetical protein
MAKANKTNQQSDLYRTPPILVSVREACRLLGNICSDKFWALAKAGELGDVVGSERKRYVYFRNLERYADSLAPRSTLKKIGTDTAPPKNRAGERSRAAPAPNPSHQTINRS